jgi:hypothetical protein
VTTAINNVLCAAEDAWTWLALLCGNHLGSISAFWWPS